MKKLLLLIFIVFLNIKNYAQPECELKFYNNVGSYASNISVECDTNVTLKFEIIDSMGEIITKVDYPIINKQIFIQINLIYFPEGIYFIRIFDGFKYYKMSIIRY